MRPSAPQETLKEKTARGILWGGINNGGQQILNLLFGIFLARLLTPSDYGMVGLLTVFTLIAGALQESGFIAGLNRLESPRQEDYNAVFWFNVLCGAAIYALLFACAPLIARLFHQPLLTPLARLSFLSFVFSSWGTTPRAILFRQLKAKQNATITLVALTASGVVGVVLAWQGFAYWGIAIQNLVYCLCMTLLSWHYSGWRPSRHIDFRPLRGMIGFSSRLLLTNIFTTPQQQPLRHGLRHTLWRARSGYLQPGQQVDHARLHLHQRDDVERHAARLCPPHRRPRATVPRLPQTAALYGLRILPPPPGTGPYRAGVYRSSSSPTSG